MAFTYVTVTHTYRTAADVAAPGQVDFRPIVPMHNGPTVISAKVTATLSGAGGLSVLLAANTDPDTTPTGVTYEVTERITGQTPLVYYLQVPHDQGSSLDLRTLAGWVGGTGGGGGVDSVNGRTGAVTLAASDVGAQLADADLTRLASGPITLTAVSGTITPDATLGYGPHRHTATTNVTLAAPTGGSDGQPLEVQVYASGADRALTVAAVPITVPSGSTWWGRFSYVLARDEWLLDDTGGGSGGGGSSYTDEQVDDRVNALIVEGANITKTYDDAAGTLTISAATSGASGIPATIVDAKGDLIAGTANDTVARLGIGTDGQVLTANSGAVVGLGWAPAPPPGSGSVTDATVASTAAISLAKTADSIVSTGRLAMTNVERTKLAGVATGATANSTDIFLLNRANHTGTQASTTITGLATIATSGSAADLAAGTVPTARLGSGTATASTFLRGDGAWATPAASGVQAVGNSGTALTLNPTVTGPVKTITLTADCTVTLTGATAGVETTLKLVLTQDATGSRHITWPASVRWPASTAPSLSTAAGAVDLLTLSSFDGGSTWYGNVLGQAYGAGGGGGTAPFGTATFGTAPFGG